MKQDEATNQPKRGKRGMGRLYKRDGSGKEYPADSPIHGTFWLQYKVDGKRMRQRLIDEKGQPITVRTKAEKARVQILEPLIAKDRADQIRYVKAKLTEAEDSEAKILDATNPPLRITNAWKAYEHSNERPDCGQDTLNRYSGYWDKFSKWAKKRAAEIEFLRDITPEMANNYAKLLTRKEVSPNTFNKHTGFLKLFFRVLSDEARMDVNPFDKIKRKKLKTDGRRELTMEELHLILNSATGELKTLLYIGTFTGLRMGDCSTLKWGEVDLVRGIIKRVPSKTKGNQPKPVAIGIPAALHSNLSETPKNKRRGYVVPAYAALYTYKNSEGKRIRQSMITDQVQGHIRKLGINTHKAGTGTQLKQHPDKPDEYIEEKTGVRAIVEVGFHSLRHTYVSLQAERGTPQAVVQAIVGHGNPAMTAHYTHIGEDAAKQAALVMPSNIVDADFEIVDDPLPKWALELIEKIDSGNCYQLKAELIKRGKR